VVRILVRRASPDHATSCVIGWHRLAPEGIIDGVASTDLERLARTAYEAHRAAHPGSLPPWEDTSEQEQKAWLAAVSAVTAKPDATLTEGVPAQSLVIQAGDQTRVFHTEFTAGRQGTLALSDEHASGQHALFQFAHGYWFVQDMNSTNGTWLNGRRIFAAQRLKKGDKIRIGRTVVIVLSA
jgi:pSer/pThr/pTyr-binding forkhead associated (FHA) protein